MKNLIAILLAVFTIVGINYARMTDSNDILSSQTPPSVSEAANDSLTTLAEISDEMEKQGKIMEKHGKVMEIHGKVMERHGKEMEKLGKLMENARLNEMDALGKQMDKLGRPMDSLGRIMDSLGKIMDRHGKVMDKLGKKMEIAHKKMNNWLFRELKKDGLIPSLEGKVSLLFENTIMRVNSKDVSPALQAKYKAELIKFWGRPLKEDASLYLRGTISENANGDIEFNGNYNTNL
jgi:hypothetical protein